MIISKNFSIIRTIFCKIMKTEYENTLNDHRDINVEEIETSTIDKLSKLPIHQIIKQISSVIFCGILMLYRYIPLLCGMKNLFTLE